MFYKLLKLQSTSDVNMECFSRNILEYHFFIALYNKSKIEGSPNTMQVKINN